MKSFVFFVVSVILLYKYKNDTSLEKNPGWDYNFSSKFCIEAERIIRYKLVVVLRCIQNSSMPGLLSFSVIPPLLLQQLHGRGASLFVCFALLYCFVCFFFFFFHQGSNFPVQSNNFSVHGYPGIGKIYSTKPNCHQLGPFSFSLSFWHCTKRRDTWIIIALIF